MTRPLVEVISFCLLLTGVALSMWGTYLLTHLYHSYGPLDFVKACFRTVFYAIVGKFRKAGRLAKIASSHGAIVPEQRDKALLGL